MDKKAPTRRPVKKNKRPAKIAKPSGGEQTQTIADGLAAIAHTISVENEANRQEQACEDRDKRFFERITLSLVALTTAAVLLQSFLFYQQLGEMQRVYTPIADQAQATRESYVAVQRPFIDVSVSVASQVANNGLYWTAKVKATNSGATPTAALEYVSIYLPGPIAMDDPEDWFDRPQDLLKVIKGK